MHKCPFCGSEYIAGIGHRQFVTCHDCKSSWDLDDEDEERPVVAHRLQMQVLISSLPEKRREKRIMKGAIGEVENNVCGYCLEEIPSDEHGECSSCALRWYIGQIELVDQRGVIRVVPAEMQKQVLYLLAKAGGHGMTISQLAKRMPVKYTVARDYLRALQCARLAKRHKSGEFTVIYSNVEELALFGR